MTRNIILCVLALVASVGPIHGNTIHFSGNLTQVPVDEVFGDIAPGDAFQGDFSFDPTAADLIPADNASGSYSWTAPFGMSAMVGNHNFTTLGLLNIGILNSFVDQYTVLAESAAGDLTLELFFQDNTGQVFSNDHLPALLPPLTAFTQRDFHLTASFASGELQVDGQLSAPAAQVVPESSGVELGLAGLTSLFILKRCRQRFK